MAMHGGASVSDILRSGQPNAFTAPDLPWSFPWTSTWSTTGEPVLQPTGVAQQPIGMAGFRHFLVDDKGPSVAQQFTIDGSPFDPAIEKMRNRADDLMKELARRIQREARPNGEEDGLLKQQNRGIPSGYAYFLQLIAHDLVHSATVVSRNDGQTLGLANMRRLPLRLETLYGGGPTECPHAYQAQANGGDFRKELRLGRICGEEVRRDIARGRAETASPAEGCPEALVGDPRNDAHAILSQMIVVGHRLHNAIVKLIESTVTKLPADKFVRDQRVFIAAQAALIIVYRNRIQQDLLRRILHPAVADAYEGETVPIFNKDTGLEHGYWLAPLEFTHGFFRFAHSMIRNAYTFNKYGPTLQDFALLEILKQNSELSATDMPLRRAWMIQWKHFFSSDPIAGNNFSIRIGPWGGLSPGDALGGDEPWALMYRDLVSSVLIKPWSIAALIDAIRPSHGTLLDQSALLKGASSEQRTWVTSLRAWLEKPNSYNHKMAGADAKTLAEDPPIPFFVRYEAYQESEGKHLGILGSIVVADVFYSILHQDPIMGIKCTGSLAGQLRALSRIMFDNRDDVFDKLSDPSWLDAFVASLDD